MNPSHRRRMLAAPILGERGGGVGQVSRLLWRTMLETWNDRAELVTLLRNGHVRPAAGDKLRFGMELAGRQLLERPEWILFSHFALARVERFLPRIWKAPYAVFLHGIECWTPLPAPDSQILRGAALRVANSSFTANRASAANPDVGDIVVCPLALADVPQERTGALRPSASDPVVLVVGRLSSGEKYKGHEQLLRSWPAVVARVPAARLVIVGDGDDRDRLRRLAASVPGGDRVEFTGFITREALERQYARAALFALPSRGEGFGLVYLEAMAHGLACIGSIHDAASEIIVEGKTGTLVDLDDAESIGRAVCLLLEHPEHARALGEAGRARVKTDFTFERFRARMTDLLRRAFADGAGGCAK